MKNDTDKNKETVPLVKQLTSIGSSQIISSKQMAKLMKRGESVYLAMIRPTAQPKQGMTQKVKYEQMKKTGPVRKAPPVAETRKRMCTEAPAEVRTELQHLIERIRGFVPRTTS